MGMPGVPAFFALDLMGVPGVPDGSSAWRACIRRHADRPSGTPGTHIKTSPKNAGTQGTCLTLS